MAIKKYQVRILDSELQFDNFVEALTWMRERKTDNYSAIYEPDGDHDGYWIFQFENEEDKVEFILRWL